MDATVPSSDGSTTFVFSHVNLSLPAATQALSHEVTGFSSLGHAEMNTRWPHARFYPRANVYLPCRCNVIKTHLPYLTLR